MIKFYCEKHEWESEKRDCPICQKNKKPAEIKSEERKLCGNKEKGLKYIGRIIKGQKPAEIQPEKENWEDDGIETILFGFWAKYHKENNCDKRDEIIKNTIEKIRTKKIEWEKEGHQKGREDLLRELGITEFWNMKEIKSIQKAERERCLEIINHSIGKDDAYKEIINL